MEEWTGRGRGGTIERGTLDRLGATESEARPNKGSKEEALG